MPEATEVGLAYVRLLPSMQGFSAAVTKELPSALDKPGAEAGKKFGSGFADNAKKAVGAGMVAAGAAVAGFAAKGSAEFAKFDTQIREVFTLLPDITKSEMGKMTKEVKNFAKEFGVLPDKVVPALYQAISAGVPKENVFTFLETAQKAAKGGVTDLETAVDGISSVVNAYGADVIDAAKASDLMFTSVKLGKTNFEQLSSSLFNVVPAAAAAGVKFEEVTAGIAALTAQGTPTSVATTQMRQAIVELTQEAGKGSKAFVEIAGKSFPEFIKSGGTLQQALQMMEKEAKKNGSSLLDMFGSVEAGQAALALTGKGTEKFTAALAEMDASTGATDKAFNTMNSGISATADRVRAKISVFAIDVGQKINAIGPQWLSLGLTMAGKSTLMTTAVTAVGGAFGKVAGTVAGAVGSAIGSVASWAAQTAVQAAKATASFVAAAAKQVAQWVVMGAQAMAQAARVAAAWLISMGPIAIVGAAVVGLVALVVKNWETIKNFITGAASAVMDWFKNNWQHLLPIILGPFGLAADLVISHWDKIKKLFTGFKDFLGNAWSGIADAISAPFRLAFNAIRDLWNSTVGGFGFKTPEFGIGPLKTPSVEIRIPKMHSGGIVPGRGEVLRVLEGGEGVFSRDDMAAIRSARAFLPADAGTSRRDAPVISGDLVLNAADMRPADVSAELAWWSKVSGR